MRGSSSGWWTRSRTTTTSRRSSPTSTSPTRFLPSSRISGGIPPMRVLGIDPGSIRTGFGVVERSGNLFRCLEHGDAVPARRLDLPHRIHAIIERVGEVMDRVRPDCVAIEEAFYHESVRSTLVLGHVRGALLVAAVQRGLKIAEYSPREVN